MKGGFILKNNLPILISTILAIFVCARLLYITKKNDYIFEPFDIIKTKSLDSWFFLAYVLSFAYLAWDSNLIAFSIFTITFIPTVCFIYYKNYLKTRENKYLLYVLFLSFILVSLFIYMYSLRFYHN